MDGKYLLYATDSSLTAPEIVRMYFEKDFVEKIFRDLKTYEEIAPLRHRRESRILGILFVCTLALRLKTALRIMLDAVNEKKWNADSLLKKLGRVGSV
jgi:transposase